tara:strand:- start:243 stop:1199 length:957 start_codon:yes stop_codon:yes gene_type:complete
MENLKRVVIKEELVKLTGDFKKAVVLNQMIYWSQRVRDFDKFINEEKERAEFNGVESLNKELTNGWIYKKAEELSEEVMMGVSKATMGRILDSLVNSKWIDRRRNPRMALDKTYQYRVNIMNIQKDLMELGYHLEGYKTHIDVSKFQNETTEYHGETSSFKMKLRVSKCDSEFQNKTAIPEIINRDYKTEIIEQQQEIENRVVVVQEKFESLFQKKLTNEQVEDLITLADKHQVDLIKKIENTHEYHTKVERCRSVMASIKRAITHGDWEIPTPKKQSKPLPKAVSREYKPQKHTPEQLEAKKLEIQRKLKMMQEEAL